MSDMDSSAEDIPLLADGVPVTMPDLPPVLLVRDAQQYKAMGDATRVKILTLIKHQPMTAKQLADQLGIAPGTAGHHLQTLEATGLAQLVARRLVRGIVAKYYTRTARLFLFDHPEGENLFSSSLNTITQLRDELIDTLTEGDDASVGGSGFPHARLTEARAKEFAERLHDLIGEFAQEPSAPDGRLYGMGGFVFLAPRYLQVQPDSSEVQE
jgi:predicted ArsR family transcriptional regulator